MKKDEDKQAEPTDEEQAEKTKGYVFIANGTKPSREKWESREPIKISNFSYPCLLAALDRGYTVYLGVNRKDPEELEYPLPVHKFDQHSYRSITAFRDNYIAYRNLCKVLKEGNIEVIHCNTPVGGLVGRLAGKRYKIKKVIYTAHGFHFFKGAPLFNRTVLKWAERIMAHWTDAIITMNREDFEAAKKFKIRKNGRVHFVHGVGITLSDFEGMSAHRDEKRAELSLAEDDIMLISMGDLVDRKNYDTAIRAIAEANNPKLHYFICGRGPLLETLQQLAESLGVAQQIHFLGFRTDVRQLLSAADIFLFSTKQEGLPRSMMEAMASGLPCVASKIRGNVDLIEDGVGGYLCDTLNYADYADKINRLANDAALRETIGKNNLETIKQFSVETVTEEIKQIYQIELER
ncbi:MAG: glycosyltransferase family 4 protein [Ruminococcaceae bacterium]|nr:glycosyltransferase family 4 protein [Oscillospiraceae bacterium]